MFGCSNYRYYTTSARNNDADQTADAQTDLHLNCSHTALIVFIITRFIWFCNANAWALKVFEQPHDKTNKMACAPSEDSNRPWHPPSLIRVFAVRMKKAWVLSYPLSAQRRRIRLGGCPGWSESLLGAQSFCWFCHETAHFWNSFHKAFTHLQDLP